jgi:hypothetical protein
MYHLFDKLSVQHFHVTTFWQKWDLATFWANFSQTHHPDQESLPPNLSQLDTFCTVAMGQCNYGLEIF